jgi:hypothetical protein
MPTDLKDSTGGRKGEVWGGFGIGCILKQVLTGTVCFPLGSEFGCGTEKEIGVEKEESLELKLGGGKEGVGTIELTIGTKTTKSEKWTAKSEKCEWCKPEVCFPDSRIETWTCSTVLTLYYHEYDKTYFYPGPTSEMRANCAEDREKCKCKEAGTTGVPREGEGPKSSTTNRAADSMLVRPVSLSRQDQVTPAPTAAGSEFASAYEGSPSRGSGGQTAIGIVEDGFPINWLYPANPDDPLRISLLSVSCGGGRSQGVAAPFHGRFLPVLAAHRCEPQSIAEATVTVRAPDKPPRQIKRNLEVYGGLFSVLWTEFDLGQDGTTFGTDIDLEIRVKNGAGCVEASASTAFVVLA